MVIGRTPRWGAYPMILGGQVTVRQLQVVHLMRSRDEFASHKKEIESPSCGDN